MVPVPCRIPGFSLLFLSLPWGIAASAIPLSADENIVEYVSAPNTPPCRGVRISEDLIATAPQCVQKAREFSRNRLTEIFSLTGDTIGVLGEQPGKLCASGMLLQVSPDTEAGSPGNYPVLYDPSSVPDQTFTYNVDEEHQVVQQPVLLVFDNTEDKPGFIISSETSLPPGSGVFDSKNQLVCLSDGGSRCFVVSELPVGRFRRGLKDNLCDPGNEGDRSSFYAAIGITAGVGIATAVVTTTTFYLAARYKAQSLGMPASVFWSGILDLQHCDHCDFNSALYAIIGFFFCPTFLWPVSAYLAASNWIEDYVARNTDQIPVMRHPQAPAAVRHHLY